MSGFILGPVGVVTLAVYSLVVLVIVAGIGALLPRFRGKWALLALPTLVVLAAPWAEEAWISWHFAQACKDAGVKVYRQVEVEGYLDATTSRRWRGNVKPGFWEGTGSLKTSGLAGYSFTETILDDGSVLKVESYKNGRMATILDHPTARYHVVNAYHPAPYITEAPIGWKLKKIERRVIDSQTGEILGRETYVKRTLPIYEALIASLFGPPIVICPKMIEQPRFPQIILKPTSIASKEN